MRFLAVHTTTLWNPRTLLGWEAQPWASGEDELHLPPGDSRHAQALSTVLALRKPCTLTADAPFNTLACTSTDTLGKDREA